MRMSNAERSARARHALDCYQSLVGEVDESFATTVADLMTDLHHFCDYMGIDFEHVSSEGDRYYRYERIEEGGESS